MPRGLGGRDSPDLEDFKAFAFVQPDAKAEQSTEQFLMYGYKVIPCSKRYRHDWSVCPFAHNGEMAARRDPRLYQPMFCYHSKQRLPCPRGDSCPYAHNLFEYWLHPLRYRTEMCQFGIGCTRPVCFFAHGDAQRRFTGIAGGPQPIVAPPEPLMVNEGAAGVSNDPLVMVNIQKAALDQLQMQQPHSDVLPLLSGHNITAAAAANLGGGMTAPLPQPFNVRGPAAANNGFGMPNTSMGLAHMSSMDAMSFQAALGAVSSNPMGMDGMGMGSSAGVNGGTSGLVSQLMASAQQKQQQAAEAANTANILEELSRQLAALEMQQSSQSAPLPQLHTKVAAAAMGGLGAGGDCGEMARLGSHHALARMTSDAGPQVLNYLQDYTRQGTPPLGRPEASDGSFRRGRPEPSGGSFTLCRPEPSGGSFTLGRPEPSGGSFSLGRQEPSGGSFSLGRPEPSGGSFSLGRPEASSASFTLGSNLRSNLGPPAASGDSGPLPDLFGLQQPWAAPHASSSMRHGLQQQLDMSAPLPSTNSGKMKPWSAPASPSTAAEGNSDEQLSRADIQLGSLSFSTGVHPPARELLEQAPKGLRMGSASGTDRFLSLPLQQLMSLEQMTGGYTGAGFSEDLPALVGEAGSNQSLGRHSAASSADDAVPLMVIGDAPVRSDQLRDEVYTATTAASADQAVASQADGLGSSKPKGAAEGSKGAGSGGAVEGLPDRPPIKQGSIGVEEAAKLLGQLPEDSVRQLLDLMKAQHPQLAST